MPDLVFTEYVRSLAAGREPSGDLHRRFWTTFRGAVVAEMRRRSLWSAPPACLGYVGASWSASRESLEELVHDGLVSVILERLQGLAAQLEVIPDVEGLVFRNLKNFFTALQRRFDPLGYRVFERLRTAVRQALDEGRLELLAGERKVDNRTLLGVPAAPSRAVARRAQLIEPAERWADDLLPELILAGGSRQKAELLGRLAAHLDRLARPPFESFRFKDLVDALKAAVRSRWHALGVTEGGETAVGDSSGETFEIVRLTRPDAGYEERQAFGRLLACVDEQLDRCDARETTREYVRRLWEYLKTWSAGEDEKRPGQRQLARLLDIPRDRFRELDGLLRRWLEGCRPATPGKGPLEDGTRAGRRWS